MNGKPPMNNSGSGASSVDLYITHLDHVGPYLKIYGQANRDAAFLVSKRIETLLPTCFAIDPSWSNERQQALLTPGTFCVFKRTNGAAPGDVEYMRTRVLSAGVDDKHSTNMKTQMRVEIEFLDYGYKRNVSSHDLLFSKQPQLLQNVPVLCSQYIVLGICSEWDQAELDVVLKLIGNRVVSIEVDPTQICSQKFASVRWKDFQLNEYLVQQKKIGAPIANDLIMEHCKKLWKVAPQSPVIEYNNNSIQSTANSSTKTPTDLAREQLAARFSLAARLDVHRTLNTTSPRPLKSTPINEFTPPKQQLQSQPQQQQLPLQLQPPPAQLMPTPLANLTNVLPATVQAAGHLANAQKLPSAYAATTGNHAFNQPRANYQTSDASSVGLLPTHNVFTPKTSPRPLNMYYNVRLNNPMQPPLVQMPKQPSLSYAPARYALSQPPAVVAAKKQQQQLQLQPLIPAFRTTSLTVGLTYDVYVSFVENGPHLFWVQLKSATNDLNAMMGQIEHMHLQTLNQYPGVGTACVARFSEDGNCYRALVSAVYGQRYRVVYVDYGNSEMVSLTDLYQIPQELLQIKPFAFRFALSGAKELGALDESMKRIFKNSALYINFQLTVQAPESVGSMQTCQLLHNGNSMLEVLKKLKNSRQAYAKAEQLQNDDAVEIRYIDSPSNFYVQKVNNIKLFEQLMDEMFSYYNTNQMVPEQLVLGAPCVVKCDREWYRAELLRVDDATIIVRHVDFGYEQHVKRHLIGIIAEKHLMMPRQAIKCCLKGFENSELSQDKITDQFEMLAEESNIRRRTFSVRVFRIEPDGLNVVNLLAKNLNVMKKLYKLSMPFEQYLSLEKGQFNASITRAESMTSDVIPQQLEKGEVLNSTTVESEDRMQMQKQIRAKNANANINGNDWDKHSSASATSSKDTQSQQSSSKRSQHQVRQPQENNLVRRSRDVNLDSFESRSTSSFTSGMSSPRKGNRQNGRNRTDSPRLQNGKQEANKNTRFSNIQSPRKDQQQSQRNAPNQRSQNAPQGFAQKPQRQKSTLDGTVGSSKRSSGVESDAASSVGAPSPKPMPEPVPEKYVPLDKAYAVQDIKTPSKEAASLSWWVSPFQFYVVPKSLASKYDNLLREMRQFYRQKPHQPLQLKVNSSVVVRQRKDNGILRGTVVACNHMLRKYRIFCVDTGNMLTVTSEDVWQVEQRFAEPPCLAQRCSFDRVVTNYDHLYIVDRMEKFVPANAKVECEFSSKLNHTYIVKMLVNNASLRDTLINAQFLTEVAEQVRVGLLAGQQVRGKFTSIRDMTNFKIQLESCRDVNFLCSYDDAKFVKSNKDLAKPFKEHYEGKSYALNIKHVCENNIIHLRPVMPLLKEDRSAFICAYPILVSQFKALVVYTAKSYRVYVQPSVEEAAMKHLLDDMYEFYNKKGKQLRKFEKDQICAALSTDGNWYRARIMAKDAKSARLDVFYLDYGNSEQLPREQLKQLEEKFYTNRSCYAVEINLPLGRIHNDDKLKTRLAKLLNEQEVIVKPIETRRSHLIADVMLSNGKDSIVDALKAEKLVSGRDIDYMRKQLDKEKPHIYEYIECVDLTTDDDEELQQRKHAAKSNSATSSPKSKKDSKEPKEPKESKQRQKQAEQVTPAAPAVEKTVAPVVAAAEPKPTEPTKVQVKEVITPVTAVSEQVVEAQPVPIAAPVVEEPIAVTQPPVPAAVTPVPDPYKDMETAVLSHCDNPAHFYVHPMDALPKLKRLTENLQIISPSMPQLTEIVNGADCISMYSMDKSWYRAKIIDAELMVLQFIDFGNTDCVSDAKEIKQSLCSQAEPFCLPFALPIAPKGKLDWADAANSIFNDSYEKILHYEYLTRGDCQTTSFVNLYIEGVDVAKKLIADGFAKALDYVSSGSSCYISHVNSITDFYIQLESDSKALELIELYLGDTERQLQPLQRFEKGSIVAALFDDDGLFYRAELLRQLPDARYEVRFIDYGNTSTTAKCLLLSDEIASVPSLSKRCTLQLPEDYIAWSTEAEAKFAELTGEGELVFTTQLLQPGLEQIVIHLLLDEDNVLDQLLPLCAQKQPKPQPETVVEPTAESEVSSSTSMAIVTHVDSPLSFYLQLEANNALVDSTIEQLNGENADLQPIKGIAKVGELFVAQFADDNEFYRARILEQLPAKQSLQYRVLFIDYGNQALVDKLFELPGDLAQLKPLAEVHALESCANFIKYPKESREALDALVDSCSGEVAVEFVNKSAQPPVVKLKTMDNALNIHEQLQKLLEAELLKPKEQDKSSANECIISHGDSPSSFYVQLKKRSADLDLIVKTLQSHHANGKLEKLSDPSEKLNGVCYSQEDDCYYRCCINAVLGEDKGCEVFLIDYGNTIVSQQIYKLPEEIWQIAPLALHCQLNEIPENITNEAFALLLEQHFGEVYEIVGELNEDQSSLQTIQLRINYKDFAEELANTVAGVQKPLEVELHNCIIVQFDSAKSFYVQMEHDVPALEEMTDKMLDAEQNFEIFDDLKVGAICVAKFPEDEVFYRAEIVKLLEEKKCEVHFIDFGNNAVTDQFRQLPEDLAKAPRYSKHCELESATIAKCDVAALGAFIDTRFSETFQLEILAKKDEQDTHVVRLFYQNTNISDKLRLQEKV